MPCLVWNGQRLYREAGDPGRPLLVLLPGSPADPLLPDLDEQHAAMVAQIPDCRRWLSNGGEHPAVRTDARGSRRAADDFLSAARV